LLIAEYSHLPPSIAMPNTSRRQYRKNRAAGLLTPEASYHGQEDDELIQALELAIREHGTPF